jgi:hypothetical protein
LILCRAELQGSLRELVDQSIRQGDNSRLDQIVKLIRDTGALQPLSTRPGIGPTPAARSLPASR